MTTSFKSKSHKCDSCGEQFTFKQIQHSAKEYGYIHLFSEKKEIIALNCPDINCFKLIWYYFGPKESEPIILELTDEPPYMPRLLRYFSSMPFTFESYGLWDSFKVDEAPPMYASMSQFHIHKPSDNDEGYTSFFPGSAGHLPFNSPECRVWFYPDKAIPLLLSIEGNTRIPLFPRHFPQNRLFTLLDKLVYANRLKPKHLSDSFVYPIPLLPSSEIGKPKKKLPNKMPKKVNVSHFQQISTIHDGSLAMTFYQLLSDNLVDDIKSFDPNDDPETFELQARHNIMMQETKQHFEEGSLNKILNKLLQVFLKDYVNYFRQNQFCYKSVWMFKQEFLKTLYDACIEEKIFTTKLKPSRSDIITAMCQAAAMEHWFYNPHKTKDEIIESDEIKHLRKLKKFEDETIHGWLTNLKPMQYRKS